MSGGPPSIGSPDPSRMRPMRSEPTAMRATRPRARTTVSGRSRPRVPPRTCTAMRSPSTCRTWPRRTLPSGVITSTISSHPTLDTLSAIRSGRSRPDRSVTVPLAPDFDGEAAVTTRVPGTTPLLQTDLIRSLVRVSSFSSRLAADSERVRSRMGFRRGRTVFFAVRHGSRRARLMGFSARGVVPSRASSLRLRHRSPVLEPPDG